MRNICLSKEVIMLLTLSCMAVATMIFYAHAILMESSYGNSGFELHGYRIRPSQSYAVQNLTMNSEYFLDHDVIPLIRMGDHDNLLLKVHHACIQGGEPGVKIPHTGALLRAVDAPFNPEFFGKDTLPQAFHAFTFEEAVGLFGDGHQQRKYNVSSISAKLVPGPTFFINCWSRQPGDTNPSHWLMKAIKFFELGQIVEDEASGGNLLGIPQFQNIVFHQCPSYRANIMQSEWAWGKAIFQAATSQWGRLSLWNGPDTTNIIELHLGGKEWHCFEDLYLENEYGTWFPQSRYHDNWRTALSDVVGGNLQPLSTETLADRCRKKGLRIQVFQKTSGNLRGFTNLAQVITVLQEYTNNKVPVITVNESTSVHDQAVAFTNFDLLVTPHGSHLANIIFSQPNETAIVEISPVLRDPCFHNNAKDAKFAAYILSTGHAPAAAPSGKSANDICRSGFKVVEKHCHREARTGVWECPSLMRKQITTCDAMVNIDIIRKDVESAISELCRGFS